MGEEHAPARQGAPEEVVGGEQAGRVHGVAERDVHEDTLHDDEDGTAVDGDADGGDDPVDGCAGGPGEEEEADGGTKGAGEGGDETVLLVGHAVFHHAGIGVVVEVGRVDGHGEDARYQDTQEDETDLAQVHAVVHRVDEGENFED